MEEPEIEVFVEVDGTLRFVHEDDVAEVLGEDARTVSTSRASFVEPSPRGGWVANLWPVGGPECGPFARRDQALAAEREWLSYRLRLGELGQ